MVIGKRFDIDQKDRPCIENLYWNPKAKIKVDSENTKSQKIYRSVKRFSGSSQSWKLKDGSTIRFVERS